MNLRNLSLVCACLGLATFAFAADEAKTKMAITISDDSNSGDFYFELDSDDLGFDLHEMQEGEVRSIVDKSGKSILITREADGFQFNVDGKTINMPLLDGKHHGRVWMHDGADEDVEFHIMGGAGTADAHAMNGVMIISEKPVDDATQLAIKSLLESAGHGNDVRFVGGENIPGGPHKIRMIEKKAVVAE